MRKQSISKIQMEKETFFSILQKAPYGIVLVDKDAKYLYINPKFTNITGYTLEDTPTGRDFLQKAYPDPAYRKMVINFWRNDVTMHGVDRIFSVTCKDGSVKEIEFRPFKLEDGRTVTTLSDITDRRRAEEALKENEEKYRILFEDSRDAIFINRRDGHFIQVNRAFLELFRCTEEDIKNMTARETYFNPSERSRFQGEIESFGSVRDFEVMLKKNDGTIMDCLLTATVRRSSDGSIVGYQGIIRDISERKQMEEAIKESEIKYRTIFDTTGTAMVIIEENTIISMANREFEILSGYNRDEIEGKKSFVEFVSKDDAKKLNEYSQLRKINPEIAPRNYEFKFIDRFENVKNIFMTISLIPGSKSSISSLLDITEQKQFQENLAKSYKTMRDIIENAPIGIYIVNRSGDIDLVNPEMLRISGATKDQFMSLNVFRLQGYMRIGLTERIKRCLEGEFFRMDAVEYTSHFGKTTTMRNFIGIPFEEGGAKKVLIFVEDITKQKLNELQLAYLATHDTLTGLPNRNLFNDRLQIAISTAQRYHQNLAVMLFDLDKFKEINDTLGHKIGDMLLKNVGDRVSGVLRQADTLARMGGDEFLIILPNITNISDVDMIAKKLLEVFRKPFMIDNHTISITTSIGVATYPDDGNDGVTLVKHADVAMYNAKKGGRNAYERFKK